MLGAEGEERLQYKNDSYLRREHGAMASIQTDTKRGLAPTLL